MPCGQCCSHLPQFTHCDADVVSLRSSVDMKYSLEARCPILDKEVMEYSFRLDHGFKYDKGVKKRILKDPKAPRRDKIAIRLLAANYGLYKAFWTTYQAAIFRKN